MIELSPVSLNLLFSLKAVLTCFKSIQIAAAVTSYTTYSVL